MNGKINSILAAEQGQLTLHTIAKHIFRLSQMIYVLGMELFIRKWQFFSNCISNNVLRTLRMSYFVFLIGIYFNFISFGIFKCVLDSGRHFEFTTDKIIKKTANGEWNRPTISKSSHQVVALCYFPTYLSSQILNSCPKHRLTTDSVRLNCVLGCANRF